MIRLSCPACVAKLSDLGVRYKMQISPYTGQLTAYVQGRPLTVTDHQTSTPDSELFKQTLTQEMVNQGADAYCDAVDYIQGVQSDTFFPSVWAAVGTTASGSLMVLGTDGRLLITWTAFVAIIIAILKLQSFWIAVGLIIVLAIVIVVVGYLSREPNYNFTDQNNNPTSGTWTEYISSQNAKYWFVCSKDGFGVGERSLYASPQNVPSDQIALFNDHCNSAPDLSPKELGNWLTWLVFGAVAVGAIYIAVKVLPSYLRKRET